MQECSLCRKKIPYDKTYLYNYAIPLCSECFLKVRAKKEKKKEKTGVKKR